MTIRDVAKAAGASPSTVSRVLTGSAQVRPEKRQAVLRAIEELNYSPNLLARSLKTKLTYSLGLVINDIQSPFYSAVAKGIQAYIFDQGYSLMLCDTGDDPQRERQQLEMLHAKAVDGIVFAPTGQNQAYIRELLQEGFPLVAIDRQLDGVPLNTVLVDNESGAYTAVRLLIEQGYRRIALINFDKGVTTDRTRERGYRQALLEAGIGVLDGYIVQDDATREAGYRLANMLLDRRPVPEALFAASGRLGIGALRAVRDRSLDIPHDIAVVIFDDFDIFSLMSPPITTVRQPEFQMGWTAATMLVRAIHGDVSEPDTIILPTQLMVRESSLSLKEVMAR